MAYQKTTWVDDTAPYLNAVNLNNLETGLESASAKADTNANDVAVNAGNISANTTKINTNTSEIANIKIVNDNQTTKIDNNTFNVAKNTENIAQNTADISALTTGELPQGTFTPTLIEEYPTDEIIGYSWYISGVVSTGYLYTTGDLLGETAMNMDKIIYTVNGWGLVKNDLTTSIENLTIGNINNSLFELPLKNNLNIFRGEGTSTILRATTATYIDRYGILQTASIDEPRFESNGLLIEDEGTNIVLYSEFDGGYPIGILGDWEDTITPINNISFNKFIKASVAFKNYTSVSDEICASVFIYDDGTLSGEQRILRGELRGDINPYLEIGFNYTTKEVTIAEGGLENVSVKIIKMDNNIYRCILSGSLAGNNTTTHRLAVYTSGVVYGGFQDEERLFYTSYIPTTTVPVIRGLDSRLIEYENNIPNVIDGFTFIYDIDSDIEFDGFGQLLRYKLPNNYYINIQTTSDAGGRIRVNISAISGNDCYISKSELIEGKNRIAFTYDGFDLKAYLNATFIRSWTGQAETDVAYVTKNMEQAKMNVRNEKYYNTPLTEEEIRLA